MFSIFVIIGVQWKIGKTDKIQVLQNASGNEEEFKISDYNQKVVSLKNELEEQKVILEKLKELSTQQEKLENYVLGRLKVLQEKTESITGKDS